MTTPNNKSKSSFTTEQVEILDGRVRLKRTAQSNLKWQFEMWISSEGKYVRKSLRTTNLEIAKAKAEQMFIEIRATEQQDRKVFSPSFHAICDLYIAEREKDVTRGNIVSGRVTTIRTQIKHILAYVDGSSLMRDISTNTFKNYVDWRMERTRGVKMVTIRNEQSTIKAIVKFAFMNGLSHIPTVETTKIDRKQIRRNGDDIRRSTFTPKQYKQLYTLLREYVKKDKFERSGIDKAKFASDDEVFKRQLIRHFVLILANTAMRTGELYNLKWGQVATETVKDYNNNEVNLARVVVLANTSKVKTERTFVSRGGDYFERLRKLSKHTKKTDFVFTENSGKRITKRALYWHWEVLMKELNIDYKEDNITYYSLRHYGITERIRAGFNVSILSKMCGTSVLHITETYSHINIDDELAEVLNKRKQRNNIEVAFSSLEEVTFPLN